MEGGGRQFGRACALPGLLVLLAAGCVAENRRLIESPFALQEQTTRILEVVPLGTPKAEALHKLQDAGVEVSQGAADTVYYCDVWNRPNGERWHLNVALLFDERGALYATKPADAEVGIYDGLDPSNAATTDSERGRSSTTGTPLNPRDETSNVNSRGTNSPAAAGATSRGSRPRVPFGQ